MQIALRTNSGVETYVAGREWTTAKLPACPLHPSGGCGIARHGSYARASPSGVRVARWYCAQGHRTFSLLPNFMSARLPGLLAKVEDAIIAAAHSPSIETAAASIREPAISLPSAVRWLRRRLRPVRRPIGALRDAGVEVAPVVDVGFLRRLRVGLGDSELAHLPPPLGFGFKARVWEPDDGDQHKMGPDTYKRTNYRGRQHNPMTPLVWLSDPSQHCSPAAHPPPTISCGFGAKTASSVRAVRSSTCIGFVGSNATVKRSAWTKPKN